MYAVGDAVRGITLAHKAQAEGLAAADVILGRDGKRWGQIDYANIPGVINTDPEVGCIGYTESQLVEKGIAYAKGYYDMRDNIRARLGMDPDPGFVKVLVERGTDKLLGAHMVSSTAGEAIAELALAMQAGIKARQLARISRAHPTFSEALGEALRRLRSA